MTETRLTIPTQEAADLAGCSSVHQFRRERDRGIWPRPVNPGGRPERYSVKEMENRLNGPEISARDRRIMAIDHKLGLA
jgi:hypothetical protein